MEVQPTAKLGVFALQCLLCLLAALQLRLQRQQLSLQLVLLCGGRLDSLLQPLHRGLLHQQLLCQTTKQTHSGGNWSELVTQYTTIIINSHHCFRVLCNTHRYLDVFTKASGTRETMHKIEMYQSTETTLNLVIQL